jgi:glycosyltransferase involved in cell wall biosynthesis
MEFGLVVIGRNEGDRLRHCLQSLTSTIKVVYVDSGSNDGSVQLARNWGADVIELDARIPFTAARARNTGFRRLREIAPTLHYVQFIDGDCELIESWPERALAFLNSHSDVGAVCGMRRERHPKQSIYNWLCDQEWNGPINEVCACGGDMMVRAVAIEAVGGYRDDMIAGEDPELCVRLRAAGWRIWRLDTGMTCHDAAMTRFDQWWQRGVRSGYVFAQGAYLHGALPERHFVWESGRAWLWGVGFPVACLIVTLTFEPWGWLIWLIYPLQFSRQVLRNSGPLSQRATLALFQVLVRFPEGWGQIKFLADRILNRQIRLIEYK